MIVVAGERFPKAKTAHDVAVVLVTRHAAAMTPEYVASTPAAWIFAAWSHRGGSRVSGYASDGVRLEVMLPDAEPVTFAIRDLLPVEQLDAGLS